MSQVLDASMTLAWLFRRADQVEAELAETSLKELISTPTLVPALWYSEIVNGVLRAERGGFVQPTQATFFIEKLFESNIEMDAESPRARQASVLALARSFGLTAYDATYLELVLRTGSMLATFDRQLADAVRKAGGHVFGDAL